MRLLPSKQRGISLGFLGILFFLATPIGLLVAWFHPAFRVGNRRDPLLILAVDVYVAMLTALNVLSIFEESWPDAPGRAEARAHR